MIERIEQLLKDQPWARAWVLGADGKLPGMICVQANGKAYELADGWIIPELASAVGCGGWGVDGILHWIGIDLDVKEGHSDKIVKQTYPTSEEAIEAARSVRDFVGGAAEIRLSKSGVGVHCRVVTQAIVNGRVAGKELGIAAHAVKHLIRAVGIKCDTTVQGRQNLWFWAKQTNENSFKLIEAAEPGAAWRIPAAWQKAPPVEVRSAKSEVRSVPSKRPTPLPGVRSDYDRAAAYLKKIPGAGEGARNHDLFVNGLYVLENFDLSESDHVELMLAWAGTCSPPMDDAEARKTIAQAWKKADHGSKRREWTPQQSAPPISEPTGPETIVEVEDLQSFGPLSILPAAEGPQVGGESEGRRGPKVKALPDGVAAQWLNEDFYLEVNLLAKMDVGTKRDQAAITLFKRIAQHIVGSPTVTLVSVKDVVCKKMKMSKADYNKALREAQQDLQRERGTFSEDSDDANFAGLARMWLAGWIGDDPQRPRRVIKRWREAWYMWDRKTGYYTQKSNEWARARATEFLEEQGVQIGTNTVSNFLEAVRGRVFLDDDVRPPCWLSENEYGELEGDAVNDPTAPVWISMKNGVLCLTPDTAPKTSAAAEVNSADEAAAWLKALPLRPHSPSFFCLNSLPYEFDPAAACPQFEDALCVWQPPDRDKGATWAIQLLQDWAGYCLMPGQREQKLLLNIGPGNDGKSQMTTIYRALVGMRNCSAVGLEAFDPRKEFGMQPLLGKTLNITGDASEIERMSEGLIKQIVGGDPVTVNRKNKEMITDVLSVKFVINANALPFFRDKSEGIWRRLLILEWLPIAEDKVEKDFAQRLIREEIAGIFNWALKGFRRVRDQGFKVEGGLRTNIKKAREEIQHELKFFDQYVMISPTSVTYIEDFMGEYKAWSTRHNTKAALYPGNLGKSLRKWLRDQLAADGKRSKKEIDKFIDELVDRDGRPSGDEKERREYYKGIKLRQPVNRSETSE